MLELLEQLLPKFKQQFNKIVSMNELTKISLQLSQKSAIVITNQAIYILRKRWLSIVCDKYMIENIKEMKVHPGELVIEPVEGSGYPISLFISPEKEGVIKHGLPKIRKLFQKNIEIIN